MKSIYDMMGKYTHPYMKDSAPTEHVESFFKVFSSFFFHKAEIHRIKAGSPKGCQNFIFYSLNKYTTKLYLLFLQYLCLNQSLIVIM